MRFLRRIAPLGGAALVIVLAACSSGGGGNDPANQSAGTPAVATEDGSHPVGEPDIADAPEGGSEGAPSKAMEITEPDADRDAVCDLFQTAEVVPLTGELRVLEGGFPNPMNDKYVGGRINSCVWFGESADLHLVLTSDGDAGAIYRTSLDNATNPEDQMCGGHLGGITNRTAVCVFGDVMYLVEWEPPGLDEGIPPSDEQLAAFMQEALART
jgi:hypothetical protein